ncbi:MAG: S1 RNA-binding domain-containing protein, partial [Ruthenibacterium sp.]
IGNDFDAVISSVTSFGVYVELDNTIEGLVRAAALSPRPLTLVEGVCLKDAAGGKSWRLGDVIKVKLAAVDVSHGNLDFEPAL